MVRQKCSGIRRSYLGCALMREPLIAPYLESGELVKIFDMPIDDGRDYYLCVRQDVENHLLPALHRFAQPQPDEILFRGYRLLYWRFGRGSKRVPAGHGVWNIPAHLQKAFVP